ncbi:MAG: DUF2894 domain-containing protein [Spongiibacteraceae bacterium]
MATDTELANLRAATTQLQASRAQLFDPLRFRLIESLLQRAEQQRQPVQQIIITKAAKVLRDYQDTLAKAQCRANTTAATLSQQFPAAAASAQQLLHQYNFNGLQRLAKQLARNAQHQQQNAPLLALTQQLTKQEYGSKSSSDGYEFEDYLRQQELDLQQSLFDNNSDTASAGPVAPASPPLTELKSARKFRQSQVKQRAHNVVSNAIKERPEEPGPLNPHMLAIRALTNMRDLSPQYLNRFVAYIDTLFWIEQADHKTQLSTKTPAKKPASKRRTNPPSS